MKKTSANRRAAPRKKTHPVQVSSITALKDLAKLVRTCQIVQASSSGLLLNIPRESFIPKLLRQNLNIDSLIGTKVLVNISDMDLELVGIVSRTQLLGKTGFEVAVDYSEDAPEYWRECLADLLPVPGEID